jgi:hypothetical protein
LRDAGVRRGIRASGGNAEALSPGSCPGAAASGALSFWRPARRPWRPPGEESKKWGAEMRCAKPQR